MFQSCYILESINITFGTNTANFTNTFNNCRLLKDVTLSNTSGGTVMTQMFTNCHSLPAIPANLDFTSCTTATSMFSYNYALHDVVLNINNTSGIFIDQMFYSCQELRRVEITIDSTVASLSQTLRLCSSLEFAKIVGTGTVSALRLFETCHSLKEVILSDTIEITQGQELFETCSALRTVDGLNFGTTTSMSNAFTGNIQLSHLNMKTGPNVSFTISDACLSAEMLDDIYTSLPSASATITVTNNPGTATDDPSIATGKGWTVTG
jgi:hypothetical protein